RGDARRAGSAHLGRLSGIGAARRLRADRRRARGDGPAQRVVRPARARDHDRHDGRLPELRSLLPQRLLALENQVVRPRTLRRRPLAPGEVRSAGHRARVLRHPFAHERLHPRLQPSVLRADRQGGALPHRQRAARHLQRDRVERGRQLARLAGDGARGRRGRTGLRDSMTLLSSLRSRIFIASALLAVLSIAAAIYLVNARVTREAERTLQREIVSTAAEFDQLRATRTETYAIGTRFMADTPHLKAAVTTDDPVTVQDVAIDFESQLKSHLLLVTNKAGRVLARFGA